MSTTNTPDGSDLPADDSVEAGIRGNSATGAAFSHQDLQDSGEWAAILDFGEMGSLT